jgi:DNA-binding NtrC family response regulator
MEMINQHKKRLNPVKILCVDSGLALYKQVKRVMGDRQARVFSERTIGQALERFERDAYDLLILASSAAQDGKMSGVELLEIISEQSPMTQILFLVDPKEIALASSALRVGTYHYAKLPISDEELKLLIDSALLRQPAYAPNKLLKGARRERTFEDMVGSSPAMLEVYDHIRQAAMTEIPVLVTGETGTGKDLAARAIHHLSGRSEGPFAPIHLGALPQDLVASELFGHEKGAFTGATRRYLGCFEQAQGGTVFLDEISTIDDRIQISLLRLLETKSFQRIGGSRLIEGDVRIIAATNEDLINSVREGRFREDLYYRLEVFHIHLPPVRARDEDAPLLIDHFIKTYNQAYQKNIAGPSDLAMQRLEEYDWPGNVREIKNVIHRAVVLCTGDLLQVEHLPRRISESEAAAPEITIPVGASLEDVERDVIAKTLDFLGNNRKKTAEVLGISRRSLYNKIDKYHL